MNNYIFSVNTSYHLMMTKLFIKYYKIENPIIVSNAINDQLNEIIKRDTSFLKSIILKRSFIKNSIFNRIVNSYVNIYRIKLLIKKSNFNTLVVFKDNDTVNQKLIEFAKKKGARTILLEDGLAIYTTPLNGANTIKTKLAKRVLLMHPSVCYNTQGINPLIDEIRVHFPDKLPECKREKSIISSIKFDGISRNDLNVLYDYFSNSKKITRKDKYEDKHGDKVLFLGQPFSELGIISVEDEKKILAIIFQSILLLNKRIIVKPHPSEKVLKYSSIIDDTRIQIIEDNIVPAELLPVVYNIQSAIVISSSAAYYLDKWYNIPIGSVANLYYSKIYDKSVIKLLNELFESV